MVGIKRMGTEEESRLQMSTGRRREVREGQKEELLIMPRQIHAFCRLCHRCKKRWKNNKNVKKRKKNVEQKTLPTFF
jgi:thioredoxin-related protein